MDTGVYGIFPQLGKNGIASHNVISGVEDAAIYVGMSDNVDVVYNQVFESVAGIEIENSRHALVEGNMVYDNTGVLIMACDDVVVENNIITANKSAGMIFTDFSLASNTATDPDSEPNPNRPKILNNIMRDNGNDPEPVVRAFPVTQLQTIGPEIVDTVGLDDGCILNPERYITPIIHA